MQVQLALNCYVEKEKNLEVIVSGASLMKNVWEIRVREYSLKLNMEMERLGKSALDKEALK